MKNAKINTEEEPKPSNPGEWIEIANQLQDIVEQVGPRVVDLEYLKETVICFYN